MQALVKTQKGKGHLEVRDVPKPSVSDGEALVHIKAAGICGTDLHIEDDSFHYDPPVIIGHEFAGEIVEVGSGVTDIKVGDRVVAEPHKGGCGVCRYCLTGAVEVCRTKRALGYRIDGAFAPYVSLPVASLHRMPDSIGFEEAALTEPLAVVVKAVLQRCCVEPEDFVVVLGCGPIGLLAAAAARAEGARAVMITGTDRDEAMRLPAAKAMGIDLTANVQQEDVAARVQALTGGAGADVVVEASGAPPAIRQAFDLVKIDGRICGLGLTGRDDVGVPWDQAICKAVKLTCSFSSNWPSWERALSLMATGKVDVKPLITRTMPLTQWSEAFKQLRDLEAIKILLTP